MNNSETPKKVILDLFDLADISHETGERQTDLEDLIMAETIKERNNMTNLLEEKLLKIKDDLYWKDGIEKLVKDLYGDYDRLSSSGKETLDKLANLVLPKKLKK